MMITTSTTTLQDKMRCHTQFRDSSDAFTTDVPTVFGGMGEHVSPGEMLAATVASCMLSMMGLTGRKHGFSTEGVTAAAACEEKGGAITAINFDITLPADLTEEQRKLLHQAAANCPVGNAIADRVKKNITWL